MLLKMREILFNKVTRLPLTGLIINHDQDLLKELVNNAAHCLAIIMLLADHFDSICCMFVGRIIYRLITDQVKYPLAADKI